MSDGDLGGILNRTLRVTCSACGTELPPRTEECTQCGAEIDEEDDVEQLSVVAVERGGGAAGGKKIVPLERASNFLAMKRAGEDILSHKTSPDEYRTVLQKMKNIANTGVKVFASDVAKQRFGSLPEHEKAVADLMERGFQELQRGALRMEAYLQSGDENDVREGWAEAERGWIAIDRAQEMALQISEERT